MCVCACVRVCVCACECMGQEGKCVHVRGSGERVSG